MKKLHYFSISLIVLLTLLSFMSRQNLNPNGNEYFNGPTEKLVSVKVIREWMVKELCQPIRDCYELAYPHAFMTKCYSNVEFTFGRQNQWMTDETTLNEDYDLSGNIILTVCEEENYLCKVKANYKTKKIEVQETFQGEWKSKDAYLKEFCAKMEKIQMEENK